MKALAFSGGKDSMACLHLCREELACAIYVDSGFTYPETREMVNYAAGLVPLYVVQSDRVGQNTAHGIPADLVPIEWTELGELTTSPKPYRIQSYLQCCFENLARPLLAKAKQLGVTELVYGQRNDERHRGTAKHGDLVDGLTRLHPIESWTRQQVMEYLATKMTIPAHYALNHSSLDCYDCTAFSKESTDRIEWTKKRYPEFYAAYAVRNTAVLHAIQEAL